jgi:hypothetical protein
LLANLQTVQSRRDTGSSAKLNAAANTALQVSDPPCIGLNGRLKVESVKMIDLGEGFTGLTAQFAGIAETLGAWG